MLFKDNKIRVAKIKPELIMGLLVMEDIHQQQFKKPMIITSINDSFHMANSKHYRGEAADIRTKDKDSTEVESWINKCKIFLDDDFDLVWEDKSMDNEHLHVEYDPK